VKECSWITYHDWLEHAFGHEVRFQQATWFFDHDRDWWKPGPAVALAYLTCLFESPEPLIFEYSDSQIARGLTYLVNTSASGDNGWFNATAVPVEDRVRCRSGRSDVCATLRAALYPSSIAFEGNGCGLSQ
jgi:hypothetical protein